MSDETNNPNIRHYSAEDVRRLKDLVKEGVKILSEVDLLKTGLSDTVKAIAEEVNVKPTQLNKVIRTVFKNSLGEDKAKFEEIEDILDTIGYKTD